jgi:hypothetical protein
MRLGHLEDARISFAKAETILPSSDESLGANLEALSEHLDFETLTIPNDSSSSSSSSKQADRDTAAPGERDMETALVLTDEAVALAQAGDLIAALSIFQEAADLDPSNGHMWENLGVTQVQSSI